MVWLPVACFNGAVLCTLAFRRGLLCLHKTFSEIDLDLDNIYMFLTWVLLLGILMRVVSIRHEDASIEILHLAVRWSDIGRLLFHQLRTGIAETVLGGTRAHCRC